MAAQMKDRRNRLIQTKRVDYGHWGMFRKIFMNPYIPKCLVPLSCFAAACLLAACATSRSDSLRTSACRLDDASSHFSSQVQGHEDDSRHGRVSQDADDLAKAARTFDHAVVDGGSNENLQSDYRRVTDRYEQLRGQLGDDGYAEQNRQVLQDFDRVTAAYRDVEAGMGQPPALAAKLRNMAGDLR
jgi:hypothetical protein